jgi:DNA-binding NarL/FixJ family response regulator
VNGPIRVCIVLADDALRQRLRTALADAEGFTVVGEANEGQQAIALIHEARPDVVLLDIGTPHASNLPIVTQISELLPLTRVIVLHNEGQEQLVLDAFRKGALGHLSKDRIQSATVVEAARAVSRGEVILSPGIAGCMLDKVVQEQRHK